MIICRWILAGTHASDADGVASLFKEAMVSEPFLCVFEQRFQFDHTTASLSISMSMSLHVSLCLSCDACDDKRCRIILFRWIVFWRYPPTQHGCSLLVAQLFGLAFGLPGMCHACASGSHTLHRSSDWRLAIFRRNAEYKHRVGNRLLQHDAAGFHRLHSGLVLGEAFDVLRKVLSRVAQREAGTCAAERCSDDSHRTACFANFDYSVTPKSLAFSSRHGILATKAWERKCLLSFTHFITLQAQLWSEQSCRLRSCNVRTRMASSILCIFFAEGWTCLALCA